MRLTGMTGMIVAAALLTLAEGATGGYVIDFDHACFRANDTISYVEVYVSVQRDRLVYEPQADGTVAEFQVVLDVLVDNENALSDTFWAQDVLDTLTEHDLSGQFFSHVFRIMMTPGRYTLRGSLFQSSPDARDVVVDSLNVPAFVADSLAISDVELGSRMDFTDDSSRFVKNGVRMIPNATRFFGTQLPLFYYYAEVYGLAYDSARVDSYVVMRRILDSESRRPVRPDVRKAYRMTGSSAVIADGFPVTTLRTGTYFLELEVSDRAGQRSVTSLRKFWTYRREDYVAGVVKTPEQIRRESPFATGPGILDAMNVDSAFAYMRYVLTKQEQDQIARLTEQGRREYLHYYWSEREREKPGATNQYFARVTETNRRYTYLRRPGWRTDRGRVFILYGEPNQTYHNYGTAELPDHEVWQYDQLEGGAIFVFYDRTGFGDLDLVHSTKRGEVYNPNWADLAPSASQRKLGGPR